MQEFFESWPITPVPGPYQGTYRLSGDERISMLALAFGALAIGTTSLHSVVETIETVSIRRILAHIGAVFTMDDEGWLALSHRSGSLHAPEVELDCGSSTETFCLMAAILAGQKFASELAADAAVQKRGLELIGLLTDAGARIEPWVDGGRLYARIRGNPLYPVKQAVRPGSYMLKNALIAAGLKAVGENQLSDAALSCDHSERLLRSMGVSFSRKGTSIIFAGEQRLHARRIRVPGDISLAAPLLIAAASAPGSRIELEDAGTNPGRTGLIKVLSRSGMKVERTKNWQYGNEPVSNVVIESNGAIEPFNISPNLLSSLAQDIPMLALAACLADGTSHIIGTGALDEWPAVRLAACCQVLRSFGADIEAEGGSLTIRGPAKLAGCEVQCGGDRAISLMAATAAVIADGESVLHGSGLDPLHFPLEHE